MLIVAAAGFEADAIEGVGLGLGIAGLIASLVSWSLLIHQRPLEGSLQFRLVERPHRDAY